MNRSKLLAYALAFWVVMEIIAFALVVQTLGVMAAIVLAVGTSLLGLADIKRLFVYLRARASKSKGKSAGNMLDGALQALGSLLLILPGFASDLVGLALKSPSIRASVADRIRDRDKSRGPQTIDLAPNEWKAIAHKKPKRSRPPAPAAE